ncbi:MAG: hypothetical protein ACFCGT_00820 [Sandaracinaceae bacterium]
MALRDEPVASWADACVDLVQASVGVELDGTPDTLPLLDHYLIGLREEGEGGEPSAGLVAAVGPAAGAYFGRVVLAHLPGGRWIRPGAADDAPDDPSAWALERWRIHWPDVGLALNPFGAALEALFGEDVADWGAHLDVPETDREALAKALDAVGPVREQDAHRLAVRYEALALAVAFLRDRKRIR